jgi:hypothetical protein
MKYSVTPLLMAITFAVSLESFAKGKPPPAPSVALPQSCADGEFLTGLDTEGFGICAPLPAAPTQRRMVVDGEGNVVGPFLSKNGASVVVSTEQGYETSYIQPSGDFDRASRLLYTQTACRGQSYTLGGWPGLVLTANTARSSAVPMTMILLTAEPQIGLELWSEKVFNTAGNVMECNEISGAPVIVDSYISGNKYEVFPNDPAVTGISAITSNDAPLAPISIQWRELE